MQENNQTTRHILDSFYDIESDHISQDQLVLVNPNMVDLSENDNNNNQNGCNKMLICNRFIYFLLMISVGFILYQNYKTIYILVCLKILNLDF